VRTMEVVFNEPFGEFAVENRGIRGEIAKLDEFFLERAVESLVVGIVLGSSDSRIILLNPELLASSPKILFKLHSVVVADPGDVSIEEKMQAQEKVFAARGTFVLVHPGVGCFSVFVDGSENVSLEIVPVNGDCIQANDVSGFFSAPIELVQLQFGDSFLFPGFLPSFLELLGLFGIVIQLVGFNHSLNLPGRDLFFEFPFVNSGQLLFSVADVFLSQEDDSSFLKRSDLSLPYLFRGTRSVLEFTEAQEVVGIELAEPFVECFSGNAVAPGNFGGIFPFVVINDPFKPEFRFPGELEELGDFSPSFVLGEKLPGLGYEICPGGGIGAVHW